MIFLNKPFRELCSAQKRTYKFFKCLLQAFFRDTEGKIVQEKSSIVGFAMKMRLFSSLNLYIWITLSSVGQTERRRSSPCRLACRSPVSHSLQLLQRWNRRRQSLLNDLPYPWQVLPIWSHLTKIPQRTLQIIWFTLSNRLFMSSSVNSSGKFLI